MATVKECEDLQLRIRKQQNSIHSTVELAKKCDNKDLAEYALQSMENDLKLLDYLYKDLERTKTYLPE